MPPETILDITKIDQTKIIANHEQIYQVNPHRFEFALLDGIFQMDADNMVMAGYRDCRADEFWVRGHIPGRPLFPGVLMIECAAQLVSYYVMSTLKPDGFIGFGGVNDVKFRGQVVPGDRLIILGKMIEMRGKRRCVGATQGFVNGNMVFEATITGMVI